MTDVLTPYAPPVNEDGPAVLLLSAGTRRRLHALCRCASRDAGRPVLTVVSLEPGVAVATDSYVLGRVASTDLADVPASGALLPARPLAAALTGAGRDGAVLEVGSTRTTVVRTRTVAGTAVTVRTDLPHLTDVRFPDWRQLLTAAPHTPADASASPLLNPARLAQVTALAPGGKAARVRLRASTALRAVHVEDEDGELLGLVMPVVPR